MDEIEKLKLLDIYWENLKFSTNDDVLSMFEIPEIEI